MNWQMIVVIFIFSLTNLACFWMGAKLSRNEPLYERKTEGEVVEPPDFMGTLDEEE